METHLERSRRRWSSPCYLPRCLAPHGRACMAKSRHVMIAPRGWSALLRKKDASLDMLSVPLLENQEEPIGITDAVVAADEAASAALTGIADAARGALVAVAAAAPDDAAASE